MFDIVKGQPIIKASSLHIPEIKAIWQSDKTKDKDIATKKLCYIYFYSDIESPYAKMNEEKRIETLKKDFCKGWKVDKDVLQGISKYQELNNTVLNELLEGSKMAISRVATYLKLTDVNDDTIKDIRDNLKNIQLYVKNYKDVKKAVEEETEEMKYKKDFEPSDILTEDDYDTEYD